MTRVALVTGAARGIGAATVLALAAADWSVVAVDRAADDPRLPYPLGTEEQLRAVVVSTGSAEVLAHRADTSDSEEMRAAVARAEENFGGLDAVIAVAGVIAGGVPLWEMPEPELWAVVETDLGGPLTAARGPGSRPCSADPPPGKDGSSPSPRRRPPGGCQGWPPTGRPRRGWPGWSEDWRWISGGPGSPRSG